MTQETANLARYRRLLNEYSVAELTDEWASILWIVAQDEEKYYEWLKDLESLQRD